MEFIREQWEDLALLARVHPQCCEMVCPEICALIKRMDGKPFDKEYDEENYRSALQLIAEIKEGQTNE